MEYQTPEIPEGINTSKDHPLKEFVILVLGVLGLLMVALFILGLAAESLAQYIPFSAEKRIAALYLNTIPASDDDPSHVKMQAYLQGLADHLAQAQQLEEGMSISVHYVDDDIVNAFATLGGNVVMYRGLLEKVPDENTLAMVMAHEIAHIKHRHPIKALGRSAIIGIAISIISVSIGDSMSGTILSDAGLLTVLKFSRDQETQSDNTAMQAMAQHYGHITGADGLFQILKQEQEKHSVHVPEFFNTHPLSDDRIRNVNQHSVEKGWSLTETAKPLPEGFPDWLKKGEDGRP